MSALPERYFTPEEYLEIEIKAPYKSQYVGGKIYSMDGAEPWHVQIVGNITFALKTQLDDTLCHTYSTDMRVRSEAGGLCTYPDVAALCGKPKYDFSKRPATLLNPQVIFEVLSPSTESFDRGDKFVRYRKLESLTDYVLVASESMGVEHFARQADGPWTLAEYSRLDDNISLRSLDCALSLAEIYRRVDFPSDLLGD